MKSKTFSHEMRDNKPHRYYAKISFGTMISRGFVTKSSGINVFGEIEEKQDGSITYHIYSKLRPEFYLFTLIWLIAIGVQIFSDEHVPLWVTLVLCPGLYLWFGMIYRFQERALAKQIEAKIRNAIRLKS
ncbi:hypothetical protein K6119_16090 [Paracrocinitomix mangrovi]|uniref:hypothetical protein n=1 Tax=Paracrocinitomix mangrovi TaxID=2862509 RepID=UPI001C8E0E1D|nr:hypothetical protein [Paracrocinitomix mangrovi]UKN01249.1 hypothetical protein K6119_16090 [Paracrocinitomix mangrovi]